MGVPHDVKGSALYAFVTLTQDAEGQAGDELAKELKVRNNGYVVLARGEGDEQHEGEGLEAPAEPARAARLRLGLG